MVAQTTVGQRASLKVWPGVPVSSPSSLSACVFPPLCSVLQDRFALHLYSVNGKHIPSVPLEEEVTAMCLTEEFVVLGTMQCGLEIRDLQR